MKKYILMVLFLVSACTKSSDSSGGTGIVGDTVGAGGSLADLNKATNGYSLCNNTKYEWKFENNKAIEVQKTYSGSNCQGNIMQDLRYTYEATTGGTSSENTSATKIDLKKIKIETAIHDQSQATNANLNSDCGKTDWVADGSYVDITNTSCNLIALTTTYQIFKISGDSLIFGVVNSNRDGTAPGMRPIEFNDSFPFIKQ